VIGLLTTILKTAGSFLTSELPPGVLDLEQTRRLKDLNHLESKKFFVVAFSVLILSGFFFASVGVLFSLPSEPEKITGFITLFSKTIEILAIIISFYLGAKTAIDLKYNSSSNASIENQSNTITENITIIKTNQKEDDYELN